MTVSLRSIAPVTRNQSRFALTAVTATAFALTAPAYAQQIVAPNGLVSTEGDFNNRFPLLVNGGMRYQQVYNASQFSTLTGPSLVTQIAFRPDASSGGAFTRTLSNVTFRLSTTSASADNLSSTFANNLGGNTSVVYNGAVTVFSNFTGPANGPKDFDTVINFATPFLYDPTAGNLLLDVTNTSPENNGLGLFFDATFVPGDSTSRVFGSEGSPLSTSGNADSLGLVTRFTFAPTATVVPEPGAIATGSILGIVLLGGLVRGRLRKHTSAA